MDGGAGTDTANYALPGSAVEVDLRAIITTAWKMSGDTLLGRRGAEVMAGGEGN